MVGDVKQSIYKFRQAMPDLFLSKYSNYSEKYANGITDIYFLRKLKNPDKSLVTVEVFDGKVRQKYEKRNTAINKEEKEFLNLWEKNILNVA